MPYELIIENRAEKEFRKLNPPFDSAVKSAIDGLEENPRPHAVKKLVGSDNGYRVRVGDYRVLYTIDDRRHVVTIYRIRHRKDAYD